MRISLLLLFSYGCAIALQSLQRLGKYGTTQILSKVSNQLESSLISLKSQGCMNMVQQNVQDIDIAGDRFNDVAKFLFRSGLIGTFTGLSVVIFKTAISSTSSLFYEQLADILPKPSFYWPLALCKYHCSLFSVYT